MSRQQHIIQQLTVDIDFTSKEKTFSLQDRISDLFRNKVTGIIETSFDELIPTDVIVKFDRFQVNLGTILLNKIEEEFPEKLKWSLEEQLKQWLDLPAATPGSLNSGPLFSAFKASYLDAMEYFLVAGTLPWWVADEQMNSPAKVLDRLLREHAQEFGKLLMRIGQLAYVRRRIAFQFSEPAIRAIVEILEPVEAAFIFEYHREIVAVQQTRQPVKSEAAELKKVIYEFVLTYLLVDRGNNFNRKAFVKSTFNQMAGHFNLGYEEMLDLFALPLTQVPLSGARATVLAQIIRELFTEQGTVRQERPAAGSREVKNNLVPEEAALIVEWMRYYFFFGSFPPGAGIYPEEKLRSDFLLLIKTLPETAKRLVTGLKGREDALRRLAQLLHGREEILAVIRLLEPDHANFILAYLEKATQLYHKGAIPGAEERTFIRETGQIIFQSLLDSTSPVFDERTFLEQAIREMSRRYHLPFNSVLAFLIQAAGEEHNAGSDTPFFHLFTDLLRGLREQPLSPYKTGNDRIAERHRDRAMPGLDQQELQMKRNLFDVLRHWLQYGYLPWWGKELTQDSPAAMWEKLAAKSPVEISWLIQYAGTGEEMKQRLTYQLPFPVLLDAFRLLPEGTAAVTLIEPLLHLLGSRPELKLKNRTVLQNLLGISFWDGFAGKGYRSFSAPAFLLRSIRQLSYWTGLYPADIYRLISRAILQEGEAIHPGMLANAIKALAGEEEFSSGITGEALQTDREGADIRLMIAQHLDFAPGVTNLEEAILQEGLRILEHYLRHRRLTGRFAGLSSALQDVFLKKLFLMLAREKPASVKKLLEDGADLPEAKMHLHDLFYADNSPQSQNGRGLLKTFREEDVLQYLTLLSEKKAGDFKGRVGEILEQVMRSLSPHQEKRLMTRILQSPLLTGLLAERLATGNIYELAATVGWSSSFTGFLKEWYNMIEGAISDRATRMLLQNYFRRFTLLFLSRKEGAGSMEAYLRDFLAGMQQPGFPGGPGAFKSLQEAMSGWTFPAASPLLLLLPVIKQHLKQLTVREQGREKIKKELASSARRMLSREEVAGMQPHYRDELRKIKAELTQQQEKEEAVRRDAVKKPLKADEAAVYIKNAGLVLLHPFLATYYSRIGLMEKTHFVNEAAQQRATHLLQYLTDETTVHPEHEMVLNKILCGLEPEEPLGLEIELTPREEEVSQELLRVVTTQWEKLKNTSIRGFQASFLQREGVLSPMDDGWKLRVDQRGYDILLQTLPWSFGMIRASWMKKIIYVEWI